jgi:hypothetical protein
MRGMSTVFARVSLAGLLLATALAPSRPAVAMGAPDCARFGLIAQTLQADFLAGRDYRQARADGLRLLGPEHPRQALIVERLARDIYTAPGSRAFSPQARQQQVSMQCLQAAAPR